MDYGSSPVSLDHQLYRPGSAFFFDDVLIAAASRSNDQEHHHNRALPPHPSTLSLSLHSSVLRVRDLRLWKALPFVNLRNDIVLVNKKTAPLAFGGKIVKAIATPMVLSWKAAPVLCDIVKEGNMPLE
jgi:hypothetical protein